MKELTLALANQARQNVGVVVNYTPNRSNELRHGVIKSVVIDWRSYTVMYRIEDLETGKNVHKVVDSPEVELTTERREAKSKGVTKESMEAKLARLLAQQEALQKQLAELQKQPTKKSSK